MFTGGWRRWPFSASHLGKLRGGAMGMVGDDRTCRTPVSRILICRMSGAGCDRHFRVYEDLTDVQYHKHHCSARIRYFLTSPRRANRAHVALWRDSRSDARCVLFTVEQSTPEQRKQEAAWASVKGVKRKAPLDWRSERCHGDELPGRGPGTPRRAYGAERGGEAAMVENRTV